MNATQQLPEDILDRLSALDVSCPACYSSMKAESDDRMPTGFVWYCPDKTCSEHGGCWPVRDGELERVAS